MALLESLTTALATRAGAALAGTAIAVGGAGAAGALPEPMQERFDGIVGTGAPASLEVVEVEQRLEERDAEADGHAGDNGKGALVSEAARNAVGEPGEPRGHAVSEAVRTANGSLGKGQGAGRRAEAKGHAAARGGNADGAADAGDAASQRRATPGAED